MKIHEVPCPSCKTPVEVEISEDGDPMALYQECDCELSAAQDAAILEAALSPRVWPPGERGTG